MYIKSFDEFLKENKSSLGWKNGSEMVSYRIPSRGEALELQVGDQVIDKRRQFLGVGTLNYLSKDKKIATVQFYDTLKGSTVGNQSGDEEEGDMGSDETYQIHVDYLMPVLATVGDSVDNSKIDGDTLNEIGDMSAGFYDVTGPLFDAGGRRYTKYKFTTGSGLRYDVVFYDAKSDVEVWFETFGDVDSKDPQFSGTKLSMNKTTDRGELYKVMATTMGIINHYLTAKGVGKRYGLDPDLTPFQIHMGKDGVDTMRIEPTKEIDDTGNDKMDDKRRQKLYMKYLKKQGYKTRLSGDTIVIDLKRFLNESLELNELVGGGNGNWFEPNMVGGVSTNTPDQETGKVLDDDDEDDEDRFNPSIINKFAATTAGGNVAYKSRSKSTPGNNISTGRSVKEGGLGDNQVAGQPVFTQTVDKSKQGYQDAMYYEDEEDDEKTFGVVKEEHPHDLPPDDKGLNGIDAMVYSKKKRKHEKPELNLEDLPLFDPPKNSSDETKRELLYLSTLPKATKFDKNQDRNFSKTFSKFLKSKGFDVTEKEIHDYSYRLKAIVASLKNYYNRPRPEQLAKYHKIDLKASDSETAHTPAYPSGHTVQPYGIATALSYKYPNLSNDLFRLADEIATGRMRMRLHFPSDYEYGKRLGLYLGQRLKMK